MMCKQTGDYIYQVVSGQFPFAATFSEKVIYQKNHYCKDIICSINYKNKLVQNGICLVVAAYSSRWCNNIEFILLWEVRVDIRGCSRGVRNLSDSSSVSEVKTKNGISCPLNIPLNIWMLDMVVYLISDSKKVNSTSSAFDRLMPSRDAGHDGVSHFRLKKG